MMAIDINLYRPRTGTQQAAVQRWWQRLGLYVLAIVALLGAAPALYYQYRLAGQQADNRQLQKHIQYTVAPRARLDKLAQTARDLQAQQAVLADLQQSQRATAWWLDELVAALPDHLYLTRLRETQGQLQLAGQAISRDQVTALLRRLGQSQAFDQPRLIVMQEHKDQASAAAIGFRIEVQRRTATVSRS